MHRKYKSEVGLKRAAASQIWMSEPLNIHTVCVFHMVYSVNIWFFQIKAAQKRVNNRWKQSSQAALNLPVVLSNFFPLPYPFLISPSPPSHTYNLNLSTLGSFCPNLFFLLSLSPPFPPYTLLPSLEHSPVLLALNFLFFSSSSQSASLSCWEPSTPECPVAFLEEARNG